MRKRLAILLPALGQLSEVWLYRQCTGLEGFEVHVLAREFLNQSVYPAVGFKAHILPMEWRTQPSRIARYANGVLRRVFGGFAGSAGEAHWWKKTLTDLKPDVVLCQYGTLATHLAPILGQFQARLIVHFHGYDLSAQLGLDSYQNALRRLAPTFNRCVVVAPYMIERLRDFGVPVNKIELIPYGAPLCSEVANVASDPCIFLAVGRLTAKKAPQSMIRAFATCWERHPETRLRIIGAGEERESCEQLVSQLGVSDAVEFVGSVDASAVRIAMQHASVFVQHSVTAPNGDMEGWPVSIAEACAHGLPIVATRHAGIVTQVDHGRTGFLVEEHDVEGMARAMCKLATNAKLRTEFGAAAKEKMEQFDIKRQLATLARLLNEVSG